ncbi:MAG: histidine phosphatase family protein [Acidimicrobiales bacterium]|nr:histidine phosphatase family protein [Acidimicrobiales bacterium]
MPIHVVRHAHAGKRSEWDDDDRLRPLSPRGVAQAAWLADLLAGDGITRVVSSPHTRCVQTVAPLAAALGLEVETSPRLTEGADYDDALAAVMELEADNGIACSHGDVIPQVLRRLKARSMVVDGPLLDQKGSVWVLDVRDGVARHGRYVPPGL